MSAVTESEALHRRVREFVRRAAVAGTAAEFDALALAIARFQARYSEGFARLVQRRGSRLDTAASIPAVPVDAFRLARVAVHAPELDSVRFETSGTTGSARGVHAMRTTETYREIALDFGRRALMASERATVVALAPLPGEPCSSSLGFMMLAMMEAFDGRALGEGEREAFNARDPARWLVSDAGVDVPGLERAARVARERGEPLLVLATAFALVGLLDALGGAQLASAERTIVMQTGGFKGRTREIEGAELRRAVARAFATDEACVVGEYGMTELTSQLYEGTLPGGSLSGVAGIYVPPPWLRVEPVSPSTLEPVSRGELGLARFTDLGNVDSAIAIVTQDLVRETGSGIELCGRRQEAPPRGCSLAIEELLLRPSTR